MEIYINEQPLNFTLEGEEDFSQIVEEVTRWLSSEYFFIENCDINGSTVPLEELSRFNDKPLHEIEEVRFQVKPVSDVTLNRLQTVTQYLQLIKRSIEKENPSIFTELANEYPIIENQLNDLLNPGGGGQKNSDVVMFTNLLRKGGFFEGKITHKDSLVSALTLCSGFLTIIEDLMREITNPAAEWNTVTKKLSTLIGPLNEVPVLLQTNRDREAMERVLNFIESFQKLNRLLPVLKSEGLIDLNMNLESGETVSEFYSDFNSILYELQEAFQSQDTVLIGDLVEYEISPRVEVLTHLKKAKE